MNKILVNVSFAILFLFSIAGLIILSITLHEISHKQDFDKLTNQYGICLLNYPINQSLWDSPAGYYTPEFKENVSQEELEKVYSRTEYKAYFISFLVFAVYGACLILLALYLKKKNEEIDKLSYLLLCSETKHLNSSYS